MDKVIKSSKRVVKTLDESELMRRAERYKKRVIENKELLDFIRKYNEALSDEDKLAIKKDLYEDEDYKEFMKDYNEVCEIIMNLNKNFGDYFKRKS